MSRSVTRLLASWLDGVARLWRSQFVTVRHLVLSRVAPSQVARQAALPATRRSRTLPGARSTLSATTAILFSGIATLPAAAAPYLMQPGDTIEVVVVGVPELSARAAIDIDGKISVPLLGRIAAAGLPLSELEQTIDRLLPAQAFHQRTTDGREVPIFISPQQISVGFAQYRPIYVGGDVAHPGELAFRASMTVGDAISAAGGYDVTRFRADDPYLDSANLRNDFQVLWTDMARAEARAWRLRTELGEQVDLRSGEFDRIPIGKQMLDNIEGLEAKALHAQQDDLQNQRTYLVTALQQAAQRIALLTDQQAKETDGARTDAEDLKHWSSMYQQGVSTYLNYEDARRASLLSATQLLQTGNSLAEIERQKLDLERSLARLDEERRLANLKDLQDTNILMAELRSRLQATSDKLLHVGILRSQLTRGVSGGVELKLVRSDQNGRSVTPANAATELRPGDRLEVALTPDGMGNSETQ